MAFLANPYIMYTAFILGVVLLIITIYQIFEDRLVLALFLFVFTILCGFFWQYSATHRLIPPNERWLYIDKTTGIVDGEIRTPGVAKKPFWLYSLKKFPGATEQPFCLDFYPASKEGYEVFAHICGTYDASTLDWNGQFVLHNFGSADVMLQYWTDQAKDEVRSVFKEVDYLHLNSDTVTVSNSLNKVLVEWLSGQGVSAKNITLSNWSLTSDEVNNQIDAASAASMQSAVEEQKLAAAKIARERQLYEIDTANQVLSKRGKELEILFGTLSINDDAAKANIISTMTWYGYAQNPPDNIDVIVGVGSGNIPLASPVSVEAPNAPAVSVTP